MVVDFILFYKQMIGILLGNMKPKLVFRSITSNLLDKDIGLSNHVTTHVYFEHYMYHPVDFAYFAIVNKV